MLEFISNHTSFTSDSVRNKEVFDALTKEIYKKYKRENPAGKAKDVSNEYIKVKKLVTSGDEPIGQELFGYPIRRKNWYDAPMPKEKVFMGVVIYLNDKGVRIEEEEWLNYHRKEYLEGKLSWTYGYNKDGTKKDERDLFQVLNRFIGVNTGEQQEIIMMAIEDTAEEDKRKQAKLNYDNFVRKTLMEEVETQRAIIKANLIQKVSSPKFLDKIADTLVDVAGYEYEGYIDEPIKSNLTKAENMMSNILSDIRGEMWGERQRLAKVKISDYAEEEEKRLGFHPKTGK